MLEQTAGRIGNQRISILLPDVPERALQHCLKVSDVFRIFYSNGEVSALALITLVIKKMGIMISEESN